MASPETSTGQPTSRWPGAAHRVKINCEELTRPGDTSANPGGLDLDALDDDQRPVQDNDALGLPIQFYEGPLGGKIIQTVLEEVQKPDLGRKFGQRDSRPLDPPPVVQIRMYEIVDHGLATERKREMDTSEVFMPGLICYAELFPYNPHFEANPYIYNGARPPSHPIQSNAGPRGPYPLARANEYPPDDLPRGPTVQLPQHAALNAELHGEKHMNAVAVPDIFGSARRVMYFVFPELQVKVTGHYMLRYRAMLVDLSLERTKSLPLLAECWGGVFAIYPSKTHPALRPSTELTNHLSRCGSRLHSRQSARVGRSTAKKFQKKAVLVAASSLQSNGKPRKRHEWETGDSSDEQPITRMDMDVDELAGDEDEEDEDLEDEDEGPRKAPAKPVPTLPPGLAPITRVAEPYRAPPSRPAQPAPTQAASTTSPVSPPTASSPTASNFAPSAAQTLNSSHPYTTTKPTPQQEDLERRARDSREEVIRMREQRERDDEERRKREMEAGARRAKDTAVVQKQVGGPHEYVVPKPGGPPVPLLAGEAAVGGSDVALSARSTSATSGTTSSSRTSPMYLPYLPTKTDADRDRQRSASPARTGSTSVAAANGRKRTRSRSPPRQAAVRKPSPLSGMTTARPGGPSPKPPALRSSSGTSPPQTLTQSATASPTFPRHPPTPTSPTSSRQPPTPTATSIPPTPALPAEEYRRMWQERAKAQERTGAATVTLHSIPAAPPSGQRASSNHSTPTPPASSASPGLPMQPPHAPPGNWPHPTPPGPYGYSPYGYPPHLHYGYSYYSPYGAPPSQHGHPPPHPHAPPHPPPSPSQPHDPSAGPPGPPRPPPPPHGYPYPLPPPGYPYGMPPPPHAPPVAVKPEPMQEVVMTSVASMLEDPQPAATSAASTSVVPKLDPEMEEGHAHDALRRPSMSSIASVSTNGSGAHLPPSSPLHEDDDRHPTPPWMNGAPPAEQAPLVPSGRPTLRTGAAVIWNTTP